MMDPIVVVNPNSCTAVTQGLREALRPFGGRFEVCDIPASPATIATQEDVDRAGLVFADICAARPQAAAFVTACFSDPGLYLARSKVRQPVIGIQEAGILAAMSRADRFGIIALSPKSIERHLRKIRTMGVSERLVADLPLPDVSAEASGRDREVYKMTLALALQLRDMGAGAVVLGCAGMAPIRAQLERDSGLAVIDPVVAGAALALAATL
ncbi:Asp/Glu/Hydantoin racemase [Aquimixticola soesokkakensis]|uniref:Asp/Glu/Hydantoin racemase n=1 Tax=Aquimixticola soesokkakensis TaxID=1519096 RepID=A0A1Y5RXC8_9RHOB|nr:aspartate/glutamate racemase family protein [Aquimixticola soesokkakensis]SLN27689.1 Asp/Glu/Hydantoin racemase [Aquimixticola soesokkakensis]